MNRHTDNNTLSELNTMCEKLMMLTRYENMKFKRCVEALVLAEGLAKLLNGSRGRIVGIQTHKIVNRLKEDAPACLEALERGKLNRVGILFREVMDWLRVMESTKRWKFIVDRKGYKWILTVEGMWLVLDYTKRLASQLCNQQAYTQRICL